MDTNTVSFDALRNAQGNCAGLPLNVMFPEDTTSSKTAQKICRAGCPLRHACLRYALEHNEKHGVWGGFGEKVRRRMRRELLAKGTIVDRSRPDVDLFIDELLDQHG